MKKLFYMISAAALALLSGCIVYQMDKTPPCDGLSDAARAECKFKPKCLLKLLKKTDGHGSGTNGFNGFYGKLFDRVENDVRESGVFSTCQFYEGGSLQVDQVKMVADCAVDCGFGGIVGGLTLWLYPEATDLRFTYVFSVCDGSGHEAQYQFQRRVRIRIGWLMLPFALSCETSETPVILEMQRNVVLQCLEKMQQDGFFSAEGRDKAAAAKADVAETLKKTVAARRKDLEDLKKAGIIDETEYAAEMKRLEGAGK